MLKKRNKLFFRIGFLIWLMSITSLQLFSQENNYWTVQQGTTASLTGGTVIANSKNHTAAYYNPGLLPFVKSNSVSINASTYFLKSVSIENGAGEGIDLENTRVGIVPHNLFGILDISKNDKWTLSYAVLSEIHSITSFNVRSEVQLDISDQYPYEETYLAGYKYYNKLRESWYGIATGYKINDRFGIGISTFIVVNGLDYSETRNANVIVEDEANDFVRTVATSSLDEDLTYTSTGLLMKLGVSYKFKRMRLGLALTSPLLNLNIIGKATVSRGIFVSTDDNSKSNLNQVSFQEQINTINKKPFTVDFGATYSFSKTELSIRAAYYNAIDTYELLDASDFDNSSKFDQLEAFGVPKMAKKSVTNFGVGLIHNLTEKTSLYAGFNTDFNNLDDSKFNPTQDFVPSVGYWDLYHYSIGLSNHLKNFQLIYGISYMRGRSERDLQRVNISHPNLENLFFGELTDNTKTSVDEINLNIGFVYYFL